MHIIELKYDLPGRPYKEPSSMYHSAQRVFLTYNEVKGLRDIPLNLRGLELNQALWGKFGRTTRDGDNNHDMDCDGPGYRWTRFYGVAMDELIYAESLPVCRLPPTRTEVALAVMRQAHALSAEFMRQAEAQNDALLTGPSIQRYQTKQEEEKKHQAALAWQAELARQEALRQEAIRQEAARQAVFQAQRLAEQQKALDEARRQAELKQQALISEARQALISQEAITRHGLFGVEATDRNSIEHARILELESQIKTQEEVRGRGKITENETQERSEIELAYRFCFS